METIKVDVATLLRGGKCPDGGLDDGLVTLTARLASGDVFTTLTVSARAARRIAADLVKCAAVVAPPEPRP